MATIVDQAGITPQAVSGDGAAGLLYKTLLAPQEGRLLSANHVRVSPQGVTRKHQHEWEQLNYILSGEGVLLTGNGDIRPVVAGTTIHIPSGELHWFENNSDADLLILGVLGPNAR